MTGIDFTEKEGLRLVLAKSIAMLFKIITGLHFQSACWLTKYFIDEKMAFGQMKAVPC